MPEENFWILWCKGRLTEADKQTIRLGATPPGLTSAHLHHPSAATLKVQALSEDASYPSLLGAGRAGRR